MFKAPDGFGPIFVTRAGATCAPFEDEVVTKYYEPGTIIAHKTQQIEKPEIEIVDAIVTGVPGGEDAKFRVKLRNNSDTQEDCYFGLLGCFCSVDQLDFTVFQRSLYFRSICGPM